MQKYEKKRTFTARYNLTNITNLSGKTQNTGKKYKE